MAKQKNSGGPLTFILILANLGMLGWIGWSYMQAQKPEFSFNGNETDSSETVQPSQDTDSQSVMPEPETADTSETDSDKPKETGTSDKKESTSSDKPKETASTEKEDKTSSDKPKESTNTDKKENTSSDKPKESSSTDKKENTSSNKPKDSGSTDKKENTSSDKPKESSTSSADIPQGLEEITEVPVTEDIPQGLPEGYATGEPTFEDFDWYFNDILKNGVWDDSYKVYDLTAVLGDWKTYIRYDPRQTSGTQGDLLLTSRISVEQNGINLRFIWYWIHMYDQPEGEYDTSDPSDYMGSWNEDGTLNADGSGRVEMIGFYEKKGKQYGIGRLITGDDIRSVVLMVRP